MSEYYLVPRPAGTRFSDHALAAMRSFWSERPTYTRSDGVIAICQSNEYRDWVVWWGTQDELNVSVEVVALRPEEVAISILGWP